MSRRLIVILVIGAIALIWGSLDGPAARQRRGMEAARAFAKQLAPKLTADPRFASVDLGVSTHPALYARGSVESEQALQDLKSIVVIPSDANYGLRFMVKVDADAATRPAY